MIHNLDQSTSILQNMKSLNNGVTISANSIKTIEPIVRRLYRLFSHTYFNHLEVFKEFEVIQFSSYIFFLLSLNPLASFILLLHHFIHPFSHNSSFHFSDFSSLLRFSSLTRSFPPSSLPHSLLPPSSLLIPSSFPPPSLLPSFH